MSKLSQLFLFLFIFVFSALSLNTETIQGAMGLMLSVLVAIPIVDIGISALTALTEHNKKRERITKYGKYLEAAGLPNDIKNVLGKFLSFSINYENNSSLVITEKIVMIEFSPDNMNSVLDIFFEPKISSSSNSTQDILTIEEVKGSFNTEISFNGNIEKPDFIKIL